MARGPVVVDSDVFSARLVPDSLLARRYEPLLLGRPEFIAFQTLAEVRAGAYLRRWGQARVARMEATLSRVEVVHSGDELARIYATLRADCYESGHPLHQKVHDGDRWVAAAAIRLGVPLVSNDRIFKNVPGLLLEGLLE
jgi:predicted nucleic acid-binding protein